MNNDVSNEEKTKNMHPSLSIVSIERRREKQRTNTNKTIVFFLMRIESQSDRMGEKQTNRQTDNPKNKVTHSMTKLNFVYVETLLLSSGALDPAESS